MTLTPKELAARWKIAVRTLERWREQGTGPRYLKLGSEIRYPLLDVEAFEQKNKKRSTA